MLVNLATYLAPYRINSCLLSLPEFFYFLVTLNGRCYCLLCFIKVVACKLLLIRCMRSLLMMLIVIIIIEGIVPVQ
jgi:hypothetical protein